MEHQQTPPLTSRAYRQIIRGLHETTSLAALERRAAELRRAHAGDPTWADISQTIQAHRSALRLEARERRIPTRPGR